MKLKSIPVLLFLVIIRGFSQEPPNPYELMSDGHQFYIKNTADSATPLSYYRKAGKLFKKSKNLVGLAESLHFQGALYLDYNNYPKAELYLKRAASLLEKTNADSSLVKTLQSLSFYYWKSGYLSKALERNHQIESILLKNPSLEEQKNLQIYLFASFNNAARLYDELGDIRNAEIYFHKSSEFAQAKGINRLVSSGLRNEALFYQSIGLYNQAISLFNKAIDKSLYQTNKADIHVLLSKLYLEINDLSNAQKEIKRADQIFNQIKKQNSEVIEAESTIKYLHQNAAISLVLKNFSAAKTNSEKVLKYEGYLLEKATAFINLAEVSFQNGQIDRAIKYNKQGLEVLRFNPQKTSGTYDYKLCIKLLNQQLKFPLAVGRKLEIYSLLAEMIDLTRRSMNFEKSKTYIINNLQPVLQEGLLLAHQNNKPKLIDKLLAVYQAGILGDNLNKIHNSTQNNSRFLKQRELVGRLNRIKIELLENPDNYELLKKENELLIKLNHTLFNENIIINQSTKNIGSQEAILQFVDLGPYYLLYLKTAKVALSKLIKAPSVNESIKLLYPLLWQNPGLTPFKGDNLTEKLYNELLQPIALELSQITHLRIIKDGLLNYIPFEALRNKKGYLLDQYSILYDYSESKPTSSLQNKNISILSFAPYINLKSSAGDRSLGKLPFSEKEVDKLQGLSYKNQSATKHRFIEDYRKYGIIHFATHAQMDDTDPSKSFIAFYPDSSDYKLYTEELYNLSLKNTQLVVLSACEAGGGKLQKGEGLMSLARAFAYAGCPAVITTLWKANDKSTAWLSERLHHYLNKGWDKAEALRQAKIDFRASDIGQEFDHPYYWANFILIGDDEPLQMTFWDEYKWWLFSISLLITFLYLMNNFKAIKSIFKTKV